MTGPRRSTALSGWGFMLVGVLAGVVVVIAGIAGGAVAAAVIAVLIGVLGLGGLVVAFARDELAANRARRRAVGESPAVGEWPARVARRPAVARQTAAVDELDVLWRAAHDRFDRLREQYAAYECDPLAVLRLPALADVSVPATARFVDAFAEAQALESDRMPRRTHAQRFVDAVAAAERAHTAAVDVAGRIRLSTFGRAERRTVERVVKMLTTARLTDNAAERRVAYAKARTALDGLERSGTLALPAVTAAALAAAAGSARLALPAGR